MTEDAKRAAKIEKKLKVLLGGYQVGMILYLRNGYTYMIIRLTRRKSRLLFMVVNNGFPLLA